MKKKRSCSSHGSQKSLEATTKKEKKFINFDYTNNLQCFIASSQDTTKQQVSKTARKEKQLNKNPSQLSNSPKAQKPNPLLTLRVPRKYKGRIITHTQNSFSNKLLLLQYIGEEQSVYESKPERERRKESPKSEEEDQAVAQIVNSCMKVITQETQNTSNPMSSRYTSLEGTRANSMQMTPMMHMYTEPYYYYMDNVHPTPTGRNRRVISTEESKAFLVDISKIESDGRTTIMVRNIPNKYTQDMLLDLFEKKHKKKFDFFYLPVDYNNSCNVGYAFINFIHVKFIADFYKDFHLRKWQKFNSNKVCQVCYARIQGTAQLQHHFEHSTVIQQKDRRYRPLIGIKSLQENISTLLQKQKDKHSQESDSS